MNKQWNKDGLTRKKLENDFRIHEPFQVLEKNLSNLLARAFSKSSFLYHYQSLAILNEIKQTDTIGIEQSFILWQNENSPESNREITYLIHYIPNIQIPVLAFACDNHSLFHCCSRRNNSEISYQPKHLQPFYL